MAYLKVVRIFFCFFFVFGDQTLCYKLVKNDEKCPEVKARSNCDLEAVRIRFYPVRVNE